MALPATVKVIGDVTPAELAEIKSRLISEVLAFDEPIVYRTRATSEIVLAVVISTSVAQFFSALASKAGGDAYEGLKVLVQRLAARGDTIKVLLEDESAGPSVLLSGQLPDEAYRALLGIDISSLPDGEFVWNPDTAQWRFQPHRRDRNYD